MEERETYLNETSCSIFSFVEFINIIMLVQLAYGQKFLTCSVDKPTVETAGHSPISVYPVLPSLSAPPHYNVTTYTQCYVHNTTAYFELCYKTPNKRYTQQWE